MRYRVNDENYTAHHCIGNGHVCAYGKGINIHQIFGPNYSTPTAAALTVLNCENMEFESIRQSATAIWEHMLFDENNKIGSIKDFTISNKAAFVRNFTLSRKLSFNINGINISEFKYLPKILSHDRNIIWGEILEGTPFYSLSWEPDVKRGYITPKPYYMGIFCKGNVSAQIKTGKCIDLTAADGVAGFVFAESFDELVILINELYNADINMLETETSDEWLRFTKNRKENKPLDDELEKIADDIAVLIKTQQSVSGGILAGDNYHLSYIRDNYGVNRGLLSLGCYDLSKKLMLFYSDVFSRYGEVHNAQATDLYGFHIHENDKTEITGYMVLMCTDYFEKTGDMETFKKLKPLIEWCLNQQHGILQKGMLPFNGDETYIAGGILTRHAINDGSMEATLLYYTACHRILKYADVLNIDSEFTETLKNDVNIIRKTFDENFISGETVYCNNPDYYDEGQEPVFRNGVRLCGHGLGTCVRNRQGVYVCSDCADLLFDNYPAKIRYEINSVIFMPKFIKSDLLDYRISEKVLENVLTSFKENGILPSDPTGNKMVGYDYGLLIYALGDDRNNLQTELVQKMLSIRDKVGAWVEYYINDKPCGTMYRPWESAINIVALIGD